MKKVILLALVFLMLAPLAWAGSAYPLQQDPTSGQPTNLQSATTLKTQGPTTANASINLPHGTAPSSPNNGDCWTTTAGLYCQINGVTMGPLNFGLTTIGSGDVLGNSTSGSAVPADTTVTALLDRVFGGVQGNVIERGASAWQSIGIGTNHFALVSNGPGNDPSWQLPPAGGNPLVIGPIQVGAAPGAPPTTTYCPNAVGEGSLCLRTDTGWVYSMWDPTGSVPTRVQEVAANNTGSVTLSATPTVGNYLIATSYSTSAVPTAGAGWTSFATHTGTIDVNVLYHLIGPSDTTSQSPVSGAGLAGTMVIEVSGLDPTNFNNSLQGSVQFGACTGVGGSCTITLSATTVGSNVLGVASANSNGAASSTPTYNAGWTHATSGGPNTITSQAFPSASSSVSAQATAGTTGAGSNNTATLILLQPSSNAQTTGWQQVGYFTTFYNGGTLLNGNARSLNCSTGTTCTSDAQGNVTLTGGTGTVTVTGGAPTTGDCAKFSGATSITDAGAACGSGGGGGNTYTFNNGSMQVISTVTTSGSQSNVTFSSIPATYRDLQVVISGRSTAAATTFDTVYAQVNGDTGANYDYQFWQAFGTTSSASASFAQNQCALGQVPGATAPSNDAGSLDVTLRNYAQTTFFKQLLANAGVVTGTSGNGEARFAIHCNWRSTAAATSWKLYLQNGNWVDGTQITLYGISDSSTPASAPIVPPQGRLTLVSHTPVMTSDQTAQSTIYYDCYAGNTVPYYDGSKDNVEGIASCEVSLTMATSGTGVTNNAGVFDVWWVHGGASRICVATNGSGGGWASDTAGSNTARGTGYSQVHNTRGYWTNVNSITHCYNGSTDYGSVSADQATLLGSLYTTAAGQTGVQFLPASAAGGPNAYVALSNAYNLVTVSTRALDSSGETATSATWKATSSNQRVNFVESLAQSTINTVAQCMTFNSTSAASISIGAILDGTTAAPAATAFQQGSISGSGGVTISIPDTFAPAVGFHFAQMMMSNPAASGTVNCSFGSAPLNELLVTLQM